MSRKSDLSSDPFGKLVEGLTGLDRLSPKDRREYPRDPVEAGIQKNPVLVGMLAVAIAAGAAAAVHGTVAATAPAAASQTSDLDGE